MNVIQTRLSLLGSSLLLLAMVVSWSSGFIGYRYVADQGSVYLASLWRFILAAAVLLPFAWPGLRNLRGRDVVHQSLLGLFAIGGYIGPIAGSIQLGVAPGTASLIANLLPLTIVVLAGSVPGQHTRGWQWMGLALCLTGMLVASGASVEWNAADLWVYSLPLLAVLSLAAATLYQKAAPGASMSALSALFIQVCAVVPVFTVLACLEGEMRPPANAGFAGGVVWLVVFATLGGYGFYWLCLQRFSIQRISGALFLTPPVTMIWAWLQFGDPLTISALAGVALTLSGLPLLGMSTAQGDRAGKVVRPPVVRDSE
ncbi:DMT family transporter [Pseudomonas sp. ANT_H12B]|uniref:DMT family transporter n=1 Tax=Pseudomonas sp. ANT_H12B TaxID=2597348 RepID=UPI0011EF9C5C|nr:DMT family transporter [Pseudomonas sp. ANT_H12B]KAA0980441.1 DMT family transporter [Pseudomonas sp. ANT_H12B]